MKDNEIYNQVAVAHIKDLTTANIVFWLFVLFLFCVIFAFFCNGSGSKDVPAVTNVEQPMITIKDVQTELVNRGYWIGGSGVDGDLKDCDTVRAWKRAIKRDEMNQYAAESIKRMEGKK